MLAMEAEDLGIFLERLPRWQGDGNLDMISYHYGQLNRLAFATEKLTERRKTDRKTKLRL